MKAAFFAVLSLLAQAAIAQTWPTKPVRFIVPFPPGGTVDTTARAIGIKLNDAWKQPVVVENRAGAGGNIGADVVAKAAPDGHTLLMSIQSLAISAGLYKSLPFDPVRDLVPVVQLSASLQALVVSSKVQVGSVKELVAYAKANPGKLDYGTSGLGAPNHLYAELLKSSTGTDILHVPYKGDAPQAAALVAGEVAMAFMPPLPIASHLKSGKLKALAVTSGRRSELMPQVPTMMEAGVPDFEFTGWIGVFAPAGTPAAIVTRVNTDMRRVIEMPDIAQRLRDQGSELPSSGPPEQFAARYRSDIEKFTRIIRAAHIPQAE